MFLSISFALLVILIPSFSSFIDTKGKLPTFLPFSIFPFFFVYYYISCTCFFCFFGLPSCRSVLRLLTNWIFFSLSSIVFFFFFFLISPSILSRLLLISSSFRVSFFWWWSPLAIQSGVMILSDLKRSAAVVRCAYSPAEFFFYFFFPDSSESCINGSGNTTTLLSYDYAVQLFYPRQCWLRLTFLSLSLWGLGKWASKLKREWDDSGSFPSVKIPSFLFFYSPLALPSLRSRVSSLFYSFD